MSKASKLAGKSSANKCDGSGQLSQYTVGTKNPCPVCGHNTTTKRDGVLRSHYRKKQKVSA